MVNNAEPVIGIVTLDPSPAMARRHRNIKGMIPTSYKKWVEQTGARAIVIPHYASDAVIKLLMKQVNGVLFPGGAPTLVE